MRESVRGCFLKCRREGGKPQRGLPCGFLRKGRRSWSLLHAGVHAEGGQYGQAKERFMVDALELQGDEGRDKLRKAAGRSTYPVIRGLPNGVTRVPEGTHRTAE